jgi:hypothetical protein
MLSNETVGAMPADNETDLVRCAGCHEWADVAKVDAEGRGACCQIREIEPSIATSDGPARYEQNGKGFRITVRADSRDRGFDWMLFRAGEFVRGGYVRGKDVAKAFAAARAALGEVG